MISKKCRHCGELMEGDLAIQNGDFCDRLCEGAFNNYKLHYEHPLNSNQPLYQESNPTWDEVRTKGLKGLYTAPGDPVSILKKLENQRKAKLVMLGFSPNTPAR